MEKGGNGPILYSNVDPAPRFRGVLREVLSRGDGQEDEKQKPSRTKISQKKERWSG